MAGHSGSWRMFWENNNRGYGFSATCISKRRIHNYSSHVMFGALYNASVYIVFLDIYNGLVFDAYIGYISWWDERDCCWRDYRSSTSSRERGYTYPCKEYGSTSLGNVPKGRNGKERTWTSAGAVYGEAYGPSNQSSSSACHEWSKTTSRKWCCLKLIVFRSFCILMSSFGRATRYFPCFSLRSWLETSSPIYHIYVVHETLHNSL